MKKPVKTKRPALAGETGDEGAVKRLILTGEKVENLTLTKKAGDPQVGIAFKPRASNVVLRNVVVSGFDVGIQLDFCWAIRFENVRILNCRVGIEYKGQWIQFTQWDWCRISRCTDGVVVRGLNADAISMNGIAIESCATGMKFFASSRGVRIRDAYIEQCACGVLLDGYTSGLLLQDCYWLRCGTCIDAKRCQDLIVERPIFNHGIAYTRSAAVQGFYIRHPITRLPSGKLVLPDIPHVATEHIPE